ncbi:MAG: pyruvate formate-lyase-activating protein [Defluviitaleaceae bacterium]|nr:pyruvate formate-lyase-activating protein [Defluviitaleaceae bacterium]MCL2263413.1 pyruvate formate-lyase-activating protein [Defluviitaleaceae bacterium]
MYDKDALGYIHSIYTGGMVDGPGIRTVVFLSGCSLRCMYCHNPDTWFRMRGNKKSVGELLEEVEKYRSYYKFSGGGITISGGEPADQPYFLQELLKGCRANGIHTVLDTSGCANAEIAAEVLPQVDLLLLDFKAFNAELYFRLTKQKIERPILTLKQARELGLPVWIRFVLVPGLTDNLDELREMAAFFKEFANIEKIDVLPFHKHGEHKWAELNYEYELSETEPPSAEFVEEVQRVFDSSFDSESMMSVAFGGQPTT